MLAIRRLGAHAPAICFADRVHAEPEERRSPVWTVIEHRQSPYHSPCGGSLSESFSMEVIDQHDVGFSTVDLIVEQRAAVGGKTQPLSPPTQDRQLAALTCLEVEKF